MISTSAMLEYTDYSEVERERPRVAKGIYKKYVGGGLFFSWKGKVKANF
jgi:hypothetical protein